MIASKIIFQSLTTVAVVGSVASGGYYMFNIGEDQYYLASSAVGTTNTATEDNFFSDTKAKATGVSAGSLFLNTVSDSSSAGDSSSGSSSSSSSSAGGSGDSGGTGTAGSGSSTSESSSASGTGQTATSPGTAESTQESSPTIPTQETKKQNYACKNKEKKTEDSECKLFTIKFDDSNKSIDLTTINAFIKAQVDGKETNTDKITKTLNKSELTSKHFFILKSSTSFITTTMVESKKTITLASTATDGNDKNKNYSTLTLLARFSEEKVIGKTNFAVVQATSVDDTNATLTVPTDTTKTYTCTLQNNDKTDLKGCSIQELSDYSSSNPFNFSSITIPASQASLTITDQKHYLIKWTDPQKFSLLNKSIQFLIKPLPPKANATDTVTADSTTTPKQTILSPISRLFVYPTSTTPFSEVIFIN